MDPSPSSVATNGPSVASDFRSLLEAYRSDLNAELKRRLQAKRQAMNALASEDSPLVDVLTDLVLRGGKRLRPALVYFGYRACGGTDGDVVRPMEIATELLHTYLLVHDDIMDNADVRRGAPAAHVHFENEHRRNDWHGDPSHYGPSLGMLVGNLAHAHAHKHVTAACGNAPDPVALRDLFAPLQPELIDGQLLATKLAQHRDMTPERLERILQLKSGRYSVERPLQLGGLLGAASEAQQEVFARYGQAAGGAFQLRDDLLGMFGDPDATGKPVGDDLREGKMTFLIYHTLQRADETDCQFIKEALGDDALSEEEVQRACEVMQRVGAAERVREMIDERLGQARRALGEASLEPEGETFLRGFVEYLGNRTR